LVVDEELKISRSCVRDFAHRHPINGAQEQRPAAPMTGTSAPAENHPRVWSEPQRRLDPNHLNGGQPPPADVIAHLLIALARHLRYLREDSKRVPAQLEDLSVFLASHVRQCHDVPPVDRRKTRLDSAAVPSRLLFTKREAAEQLGVSLRTIERLISAGRLPLVHVEGAARVRVSDLEAYVQGLEADDRTNPSHAD
jgi:excisionase family DNA binding protein